MANAANTWIEQQLAQMAPAGDRPRPPQPASDPANDWINQQLAAAEQPEQASQPQQEAPSQFDRGAGVAALGGLLGPLGIPAAAYGAYKMVTAPEATDAARTVATGAAEGGTAGFAGELAGAGMNAGRMLYNAIGGGPDVPGSYARARDSAQAAIDEEQAKSPGRFMVGQGLGAAATALVPGGGQATAVKTIAQGAGFGALNAAGNSRADLTKGEFEDFAKDTSLGTVIGAGGGALAHGAVAGTGMLVRRLNQSKIVGAVGGFLKKVVEKNGSVEAQRATASRTIEAAVEEAGDELVTVNNYLALRGEILKSPKNKEARSLLKEINELIGRNTADEGGAAKTLAEVQNDLMELRLKSESLKKKPHMQRWVEKAKDALLEDLKAATQGTPVAAAAQKLLGGRAQHAAAMKSDELASILVNSEDPLSLDKHIDPRKFAVFNSGSRGVEIQKMLANDPQRLKAWNTMADAARMLAKREKAWLPESMRSEKASAMLGTLMTARNISKMIDDPAIAQEFAKLIDPARGATPDVAIKLLTQISARLSGIGRNPETGRLRIEKPITPREEEPPPPRDNITRAAL
jgi:hypothetical protein